jgi:uncharacterized protein YcfL
MTCPARLRLASILLLVVLAPVACSSSNVYQTNTARPNAIDFQSKISNPFLRDRVNVTSVFVGQTPDGCLRVQPNIQNTSGANVFYMYRFTWFDAQGLKLSTNTDFWTRRELNAGGIDEITAVSPTNKAVDWRLEIRPWDR